MVFTTFTDSVNAVFQALRGLRHDGVPLDRSRKFSHLLPGCELTLARGGQSFGSGGYSASWAINGDYCLMEVGSENNQFINSRRTKVKITGPFAVVRQSEGDCVGEGRDWSWIAVVAPEDEYKEMLAQVIGEVSLLDFDQCKKWLDRCLPDGVRRAVRERKDSLAMERSREEERLRKEADDELWEECLEQARQYSGDERTAQTVAKQLYWEQYRY